MMTWLPFGWLFLAAAASLLSTSGTTHAATFVDDFGTEHSWTTSQPTLLVGAMDAITLFHFGMSASQIEGTFAERTASGSNFGGTYFDGNEVDHGDHGSSAYNPAHFPADPDDYSPSCSSTNFYCPDIDIAALNANGWPDLVVAGSFYSSLITDEFRGNATQKGVPIIELLDAYGSPAESSVLPSGMTEVIARWLELTIALGVEGVPERVAGDKELLCQAAATFTNAAQSAQQKGVRVMAGFLPYKPASVTGEIGAFLAAPERDTVLAMMEELGMPLLHTDAEVADAYEYQVTPDFEVGLMPSENIMSNGALGDPVPYWIDFWLYDDRVTLDFISDSFAQSWPHVAVTNKQYAYFPSNARIYSYRHATEILTIVAEPLAAAERLNDPTTSCTNVVGGPASEAHRMAGLKPGEYACFEPITYSFCGGDGGGSSAASSTRSVMFLVSSLLVFCLV